jgi:O-antigen ligase
MRTVSFLPEHEVSEQPGFLSRIKALLLQYKLNHSVVFLTLLLLSLSIGVGIAKFGLLFGMLAVIVFIGLPAVYAIIVYPKFGIAVLMILAYILLIVPRMGIDFPVGTIIDALEFLLIFGFFLKQKYDPSWKIYRNPVTVMVLLWIGYNLLQAFNPSAESRLAWVYTVRTVAVVMLLYFIFLYHLRDKTFIRFVFKLWIFLSFLGALYALKQQFIGFFPFEQKWLDDDPVLTNLYFVGGFWRKFSFFADPVTFSYNMVTTSILCFCLSTGPLKLWKKIVLVLLGMIFIFAMLFSGTRGAYVLVPAALFFFCVLRFNVKILMTGLVMGAVLVFILYIPSDDPTLRRFQSAFSPEADASYNVRKANQEKIRPYILSHPLGGGLGATGTWGQRFSPHSWLANFPPDSGYVRVAVELGWVGLLLFCTFMYVVLHMGIRNYFRIRDPVLKTYALSLVLIIFVLNIGNFPQEALVQYPTNVLFYLCIALIHALLLIDRKQNELKTKPVVK